MIFKDRDLPISISKLQSLLRRINKNHPQYKTIKNDLLKIMAGFKGEQYTDYPLSFLPQYEYFILHDLRIPYKQTFFQMDTLLLSKRFFLILEIKNIAGTLIFDQEFHQLIRIVDGKEEALSDPITQVSRHEYLLKKWLSEKFHIIPPIESFIIISHPQTLVKTHSKSTNISNIVIRREYLPKAISKLVQKHKSELLTEKEMRKIARHLKKAHTPLDFDVLEKYQIRREEIIGGIQCTSCERTSIKRGYGTWYCTSCKTSDKHAHIEAIKDYVLLLNNEVTNKEIREFLMIDNIHLVKRILKDVAEETTGTTKGRKYLINEESILKK